MNDRAKSYVAYFGLRTLAMDTELSGSSRCNGFDLSVRPEVALDGFGLATVGHLPQFVFGGLAHFLH